MPSGWLSLRDWNGLVPGAGNGIDWAMANRGKW
jgi:hypothetical protein